MNVVERVKNWLRDAVIEGLGYTWNISFTNVPNLDIGDIKIKIPSDYEVALMWRNQGQTQKATAELMGIPQNRVKYLWRQAILKGDCEKRR